MVIDKQVAFDDATNEVARLEGDYHALGNMDDLSNRKETLQGIIRDNRTQMQLFNVRSVSVVAQGSFKARIV